MQQEPIFCDVVESAKDVSQNLLFPHDQLKEKTEIERYFSLCSSKYIDLLEKIHLKFLNSGTKETNTRIFICIPSGHEEKNIYRTLKNLSLQSKSLLKQTEILILDNIKENELFDKTIKKIQLFKRRYPPMNIYYVRIIVPSDMPFGNIRKISLDIALYKIYKRHLKFHINGRHLLVMNDADCWGYSNNYLSSIFKEFEKDNSLGILVGSFLYPLSSFKKYPLLAVAFLFHRFYRNIKEKNNSSYIPWTTGRVTVFRADIYAGIGGINGMIDKSSDIEIRERILKLRNKNFEIKVKRGNFYIITDPRRVLTKISMPDKNYSDEFEDINWTRCKKIYGKSWKDNNYLLPQKLIKEGVEKELSGILIKKAYRDGFIKNLKNLDQKDIIGLSEWLRINFVVIKEIFQILKIKKYKIYPTRKVIINRNKIPRIVAIGDISGLESILFNLRSIKGYERILASCVIR